MASIACFISAMLAAPALGGLAGLVGEAFAWVADSALRLVMLEISSREALVCSSEEAWAVAPSARVALGR